MTNGKAKQAYLLVFVVLLLLLSSSKTTRENIRGTTAAILSPAWEQLTGLRLFFQTPFAYFSDERYPTINGLSLSHQEEIARLQLENRILHNELNHFQEILQRERLLASQLKANQLNDVPMIDRHQKELEKLLQLQLQAIPARVIFRSRLSWSSSLWINVGEADNHLLGRVAIAKNSPVVIGTSIVGVVDYVGNHQSRVRLITDSGLTPSVRAVRGDLQNRLIVQQMDVLIERIVKRPDLFSGEEDQALVQKLMNYKEKLSKHKDSWFLAKGELQGSSKALWRKQSQVLRGIGFNYDFPDEEGPARELRNGKPINATHYMPTMTILQVNDLLITNGMDGVFPSGLQVAVVTAIDSLREGDYYYELEAKPTAGNLEELSVVFVMPPLGYDKEERPPLIGR